MSLSPVVESKLWTNMDQLFCGNRSAIDSGWAAVYNYGLCIASDNVTSIPVFWLSSLKLETTEREIKTILEFLKLLRQKASV